MTLYLVSCSCGRQLEVDAGQAGTKLSCECGQAVVVPTIRGLRQLPTKADFAAGAAAATAASWSTWRGVVFSLGLLLVVLALIFAGFNAYNFWRTRRIADPLAIAIELAQKEVDGMDPIAAVGSFRQEEAQGLGDQMRLPWAEIDEVHAASRQRMILGMIAAGVGLLATAGSLMSWSKKTKKK